MRAFLVQWTMRTKLLGLGGLLVFLSLTATGLFSMWKAAAALRQSAEQAAVVQSQGLAGMVAERLNEKKWTAKGLASMSVLNKFRRRILHPRVQGGVSRPGFVCIF